MRYRNFIFIFWRGTIMMLPGRVLSGAPLAKAAMTWRCLKHVFKNWPQPFKASKPEYPSIMKPSHCACAPIGSPARLPRDPEPRKNKPDQPICDGNPFRRFFSNIEYGNFFVFKGTSIGALTGAFLALLLELFLALMP